MKWFRPGCIEMKSSAADIERFAEEHRLSGAVRHGNTLYLAGQVADDSSLDTEGQTTDILHQIDAILAEAGTDKTRLLSVQIFMTDITEIDAVNRAWDAWLITTTSQRVQQLRHVWSIPTGQSKSRQSRQYSLPTGRQNRVDQLSVALARWALSLNSLRRCAELAIPSASRYFATVRL